MRTRRPAKSTTRGRARTAASPAKVPQRPAKARGRTRPAVWVPRLLTDPERVGKILAALAERHPEARTTLVYSNPLELLIATILSAQCTDERVNAVTRDLFPRYRTARDYAEANLRTLEEQIRPTGYYRSKARSIQRCCAAIEARFKGEVPRALEEMVTLPGVGRKTANLVLGEAFGIPGIVVDTHVRRVARRLALARSADPTKIELELQKVLPQPEWYRASSRLLLHGRHTCRARTPLCGECPVEPLCTSPDKRL